MSDRERFNELIRKLQEIYSSGEDERVLLHLEALITLLQDQTPGKIIERFVIEWGLSQDISERLVNKGYTPEALLSFDTEFDLREFLRSLRNSNVIGRIVKKWKVKKGL